MKRKLLAILFIFATCVFPAFAIEKVKIGDLYYNLNFDDKTAEVTYENRTIGSNYTGLTVVSIPQIVTYNSKSYKVTRIGSYSFDLCANVISVIVPNSILSIGEEAFDSRKMVSIDVASDNPNYASINGVLFDKNISTLVRYPSGKKGAYSIPNTVSVIGEYAFEDCKDLTSIIIPNSVTSIGVRAFHRCHGLTSITIPQSVTSIENQAFYYCDGLTSVTLPDNVTNIASFAFHSCHNLKSPIYNAHCFVCMPQSYKGAYTIPNGIESIAGGAFYQCSQLTSVNIPNSVTSIGVEAFKGCSKLTSPVFNAHCFAYLPRSYKGAFTIPDGIESIAPYAFENCENLTSVTIPNSVISIGSDAFALCKGLTSITIPNSVTSIGYGAFFLCKGLTFVTIGNSVTSIGDNTFSCCNSLQEIVYPQGLDISQVGIPSSTKLIAYTSTNSSMNSKSAYYVMSGKCGDNLTWELNEENGVLTISGTGAMWNWDEKYNPAPWSAWQTARYEALSKGPFSTASQITEENEGKIKMIIINEGITYIGNFAFHVSTKVHSITIPNTIKSIGHNVFPTTDAELESIYVDEANNSFCDVNGVLYDKSKGILYQYPAGKKATLYIIPSGVYTIGESAFSNCEHLQKIIMPESLKFISDWAFNNCSSLTTVKIASKVILIDKYAFNQCENLKELHYPEGLDLSDANIPSFMKLIAYSPTNSSTSTTTASSRSNSATNSATTSRTASSSTTSQSTTPPKNTYTKPTTTSRPICTILSPKEGDPYSTPTIRLEYKIENISQVESVKFYVNGIERKPKNNGSNKGVRLEYGTVVELEMPTENGKNASISIVVVDANNDERIVGRRKLKYVNVHKPTLHVFAVGVNKYKAKGFDELRYAEKDACDFSKTIIDIADKNMYERVDTTVILGSRANRSYILEQLMKLEGRVKSNDIVMLFFSGHGKVENDKSYFITSDAEYVIQGLATRDIVDQIELMKKRSNVFVFMDACHSGATKTTERTKGNAKPITLAESEVIGYYSCAEKQESIEDENLKNGVFTYALVKGLKGTAANEGQITIHELAEYIRKWVREKTNGRQSPTLDYQGDDYVIFYKKK